MAQARTKKSASAALTHQVGRGLQEGALFLLGAVALYLLISLASYHAADPGWSHAGPPGHVANAGGVAGAWFADVFLYLFGFMAYLFPVMVGYSGWLVYKGRRADGEWDLRVLGLRWLGFLLTVAAGCGLATLHFGTAPGEVPLNAGGILGNLVGQGLARPFSFLGATLFLLALFLGGVTLFTGLSWLGLMDRIGRMTLLGLARARYWLVRLHEHIEGRRARRRREETVKVEQKKAETRKPLRIEPVIKKVAVSERAEKERQVPLFDPPPNSELPALSLLDPPSRGRRAIPPMPWKPCPGSWSASCWTSA